MSPQGGIRAVLDSVASVAMIAASTVMIWGAVSRRGDTERAAPPELRVGEKFRTPDMG